MRGWQSFAIDGGVIHGGVPPACFRPGIRLGNFAQEIRSHLGAATEHRFHRSYGDRQWILKPRAEAGEKQREREGGGERSHWQAESSSALEDFRLAPLDNAAAVVSARLPSQVLVPSVYTPAPVKFPKLPALLRTKAGNPEFRSRSA